MKLPNWATDSYKDDDVMITEAGNESDTVVPLVITVLAMFYSETSHLLACYYILQWNQEVKSECTH